MTWGCLLNWAGRDDQEMLKMASGWLTDLAWEDGQVQKTMQSCSRSWAGRDGQEEWKTAWG